MDGKAGRVLAQRLAGATEGAPQPPIRGSRDETGVPPIFRWFAVARPPAAEADSQPAAA